MIRAARSHQQFDRVNYSNATDPAFFVVDDHDALARDCCPFADQHFDSLGMITRAALLGSFAVPEGAIIPDEAQLS